MTTDQAKPTARRQCSTCASELGFTEGDPCDNCVTAKPTALLPCAFCGCQPDIIERFDITCTNCGVTVNGLPPEKNWNKRAHSPAQAELINAVFYALKEGCFFPVPEPKAGASTQELIQWGAMRNLHDAIAAYRKEIE